MTVRRGEEQDKDENPLRSRQMRTHLTHASFLFSGLRCHWGFSLFFFSLQPNRFLDWRRSQVIMTDIEGALLSDP